MQSMRGNTLPVAFDTAIIAENNLIQAGKIAPRPSMPIFLELQPVPEVVPTLTSISPIQVLPAFDTSLSNLATNQSQELKEIKELMCL